MDENLNLTISRRVYKTHEFDEERRKPPNDIPLSKRLRSSFACNSRKAKKFLSKLFPFIKIYRKYNFKLDFLNDVIAGLTVGVMHLPQGMAYALLANLPAYSGLYTSLFPTFIYFFLGTSRHISVGTGALVCLLLGSAISKYEDTLGPLVHTSSMSINTPGPGINISQSTTSMTSGYTSYTMLSNNVSDAFNNASTTTASVLSSGLSAADRDSKKLVFATTVCLVVGLLQIIFSIFHLGFVAKYLSAPLISGFITAGAIEVVVSQVKDLLGIKIHKYTGNFQFINTIIDIIRNITDTNIATLVGSIICLVVLYIVRTQVNDRFAHKLKIPLPIEFIVLVIGTIASYFGKLDEKYDIEVIGNIPLGFPQPSVPPLNGITSYASDLIILAIVSFAQTFSLAKLLAKKRNYSVDANQDMLAYGAGNVFAAFFSCMPLGASLSRTSVQDSLGRTQIASIFSIGLVLVIIMAIGPLFESLPTCVLSAIIVITLKDMLLQIKEGKRLWSVSKYDFIVWIFTFLGVLIFAFDVGMWIGLAFAFWTVLFRTQRAKGRPLGNANDTEIYRDEGKYNTTPTFAGMKIVGFRSPLYFANAEIYLHEVQKCTGVIPEKVKKRMKKHQKKVKFEKKSENDSTVKNGHVNLGMEPDTDEGGIMADTNSITIENENAAKETFCSVRYIILDFSSIIFIDTVGCKILKQILNDYKGINVKVMLAGMNSYVWDSLNDMEFITPNQDIIYLTVPDAVAAISYLDGQREEEEVENVMNGDLSQENEETMDDLTHL